MHQAAREQSILEPDVSEEGKMCKFKDVNDFNESQTVMVR